MSGKFQIYFDTNSRVVLILIQSTHFIICTLNLHANQLLHLVLL